MAKGLPPSTLRCVGEPRADCCFVGTSMTTIYHGMLTFIFVHVWSSAQYHTTA